MRLRRHHRRARTGSAGQVDRLPAIVKTQPKEFGELIGRGEFDLALGGRLRRQNREKLVAARGTPERGNAQRPPDGCRVRLDVVGRDASHFDVSADRTVGVKCVTQRIRPSVKARLARLASPGINTNSAEDVIWQILTARPARSVVLADGAGHLYEVGLPSRVRPSIGQCMTPRKRKKYRVLRVQ